MTVEEIITERLKTWFPTIDIGTAVDIAKVRADLEQLADATPGADTAAAAKAATALRLAFLAEIEALPRYEPELRKTGTETRNAECDHGESVEINVDTHEAAMRAVAAGEPANFVSIQSVHELLGR